LKNKILLKLVIDLVSVLDSYKSVDSLAGQLVINANDGSFGDSMVLDESGFDFGGGETMAGDVDDVVDAAADPVVTLVVTSSSVTCELWKVSEYILR
jgi:hypothetical protein